MVKDLVTVVMLCQHRLTFQRALDSVLSQTYRNLEIIIVQDGCPQATRPLCRAARCSRRTCECVERLAREAEMDNCRVHYLKAAECAGYGARQLRNLALANATGRYIAYLDDDNWWEPDHIEALLKTLGQWINFAWSGSILREGEKRIGTRINARPCRNGIDTSEIIHHRYLTEEVGGWSDRRNFPVFNFRLDQDWGLVKKFMSAGYKGFHLDKLTVNYTATKPTRRYLVKKRLYSLVGLNLAPGETLEKG